MGLRALGRCAPCRACLRKTPTFGGRFSSGRALRVPTSGRLPAAYGPAYGGRCAVGHPAFGTCPEGSALSPFVPHGETRVPDPWRVGSRGVAPTGALGRLSAFGFRARSLSPCGSPSGLPPAPGLSPPLNWFLAASPRLRRSRLAARPSSAAPRSTCARQPYKASQWPATRRYRRKKGPGCYARAKRGNTYTRTHEELVD